MKKKIIKEVIFSKHYSGYPDIKFSEFPKDIKPDDIINIHREEAYYSENNSNDEYTVITIVRERLETENEAVLRINKHEKLKKELRDRRFKTYQNLKKEFEDEL